MIHEEVQRFEKLSGESANDASISRIGGYLDGYEKGRADAIEELYRYLYEKLYEDNLPDGQIMYEIRTYIERMKEQKNE